MPTGLNTESYTKTKIYFPNFRQQKYVDANLPSQSGTKNKRKPQAMVKPNSRDAKQYSLENGMIIKSKDDINQDPSLPSLDTQQSQQLYMRMNQTLEDCEIESLDLLADTIEPQLQVDKMEEETEDTNKETEDADNPDKERFLR